MNHYKIVMSALCAALMMTGVQAQQAAQQTPEQTQTTERVLEQIPYAIDSTATIAAPWQVGEVVYVDGDDDGVLKYEHKRFFMGVTTRGQYLVREETQSRYVGDRPWEEVLKDGQTLLLSGNPEELLVTDPFLLTDAQSVTGQVPLIHGLFTNWFVLDEGEKKFSECFYNQGTTEQPCVSWYADGNKYSETWFVQGLLERMDIYFPNGQKLMEMWVDLATGEITSLKEWNEQGQLVLDGEIAQAEFDKALAGELEEEE